MSEDNKDTATISAPTAEGTIALDRLAVTTGRKIPPATASTLIQRAEDARKNAEELARLAALARAKEIKKKRVSGI